jgi:hypothetical protein
LPQEAFQTIQKQQQLIVAGSRRAEAMPHCILNKQLASADREIIDLKWTSIS